MPLTGFLQSIIATCYFTFLSPANEKTQGYYRRPCVMSVDFIKENIYSAGLLLFQSLYLAFNVSVRNNIFWLPLEVVGVFLPNYPVRDFFPKSSFRHSTKYGNRFAIVTTTESFPNGDGVVALAHAEAAMLANGEKPKNWEPLLRTLAGFESHPSAAPVLVVDYATELLTPSVIEGCVRESNRPLPRWRQFAALNGHFDADLAAGRAALQPRIRAASNCERTPQPLAPLRVTLQCGGSGAFSRVSSHPAVGIAAVILIEHGVVAVLAETDELSGAESYILLCRRTGQLQRAPRVSPAWPSFSGLRYRVAHRLDEPDDLAVQALAARLEAVVGADGRGLKRRLLPTELGGRRKPSGPGGKEDIEDGEDPGSPETRGCRRGPRRKAAAKKK